MHTKFLKFIENHFVNSLHKNENRQTVYLNAYERKSNLYSKKLIFDGNRRPLVKVKVQHAETYTRSIKFIVTFDDEALEFVLYVNTGRSVDSIVDDFNKLLDKTANKLALISFGYENIEIMHKLTEDEIKKFIVSKIESSNKNINNLIKRVEK